MRRMQRLCWAMVCAVGPALAVPAMLRGDEKPGEDPDWVEAMAAVHAKFKGQRRTFAQFGDGITFSMAFWAPLREEPKDMSPPVARAYWRVEEYMQAKCWSKWKGAEFGNESSTTIRWAHRNVDLWLERLNPEVVLIMFGSNDVREIKLEEYTQKTREVVRWCLKNGTVVILSTMPPCSGRLKESQMFAKAVADIARDERVPLVDYYAEILRRRPDDWDGSLKKFSDVPGGEYEVPTLIARNGMIPSNPQAHVGSFSEKALNTNGYGLRNYLVLMAYNQVIDRVLDPKVKKQDAPENDK